MRGYGEPIEVDVRESGEPSSFQWRGRRYRVTQVLDAWREQVPWWRLTLADGPDSRVATDTEQQPVPQDDAPLETRIEQRLWRVEAAAGRLASSGVFHLVQHGPHWSLRSLTD